jgi:hypothetical protein
MDVGQTLEETHVRDGLFKILLPHGSSNDAVHSLTRNASPRALVLEQEGLASLDTSDGGKDINAMDNRAGEKTVVTDTYNKVQNCVAFLSKLH